MESGIALSKECKKGFRTPGHCFYREKIAVFCDSEFFHGYDWENKSKEIKSNRDFWIPKIEKNMERDRKVTEKLTSDGWTVLRFWGNDIKKKLSECADKIESVVRTNE